MHVYSYKPDNRPPVRRKRPIKRLIFGVLLVAAGLFIILSRFNHNTPQPSKSIEQPSAQKDQQEEKPETEPLPSVQDVVDAFVKNNPGKYSVIVTDLATNTQLASYQPDESYFAASIYKLYVAYLGYMDIEAGKHKIAEPFLGNWTRKECLDKMIRESHSPCAEKLWVEQGKEASTKRLKDEFGLMGTSMVGITTTAHDANIILARLDSQKDLNETHTNLFLESLQQNIYREAIPKGVPELVVRDKVGFSEFADYHDAAIVTLPNGRNVAVTFMTRGAGASRIATLTKNIFTKFTDSAQ